MGKYTKVKISEEATKSLFYEFGLTESDVMNECLSEGYAHAADHMTWGVYVFVEDKLMSKPTWGSKELK